MRARLKMAHSVQLACLITLLGGLSANKDQSRWSRQISSYTSDISDWVPLPGPVREPPQIKRQAVAEPRILSEPFPGFARPTGFSQDFPSRMFLNTPANRQLYLQSVPSAPQNYLTDQGFGQSIRFGLAQPNFPLNQVFVAPQYNFDSIQQFKSKPTPIPTTQIKFDSVPSIQNGPSVKPFIQAQKTKVESPKFVDGYRVENISRDAFIKKKPQPIPKIKFESYDKPQSEAIPLGKPNVEREEVQLLYVPLESLNRGQFNFRNTGSMSQLVNTELFSTNPRPNPLRQNLAAEYQHPPVNHNKQRITNFNGHLNGFDQAQTFMTFPTPIVTIPTTTPKPKKLKPHQPPLAIFLTQEAKKNDQVKVGDVLYSLKNANTVAVLDSVNPINAPKVFIGPNSLTPPENYVKFELPYLSNIEHTDKKLRQLPFFVAPLSYNTPQGFAKIPFPSPHVGSVVINSQIRETSPPLPPTTNADVIPNSYTAPPQYKPKEITQKPRFSYYSTVAPNTPPSPPEKYEPNYYSFEPQTVSTLRPIKEPEPSVPTTPPKGGSYFLSDVGNQYDPSQYVNFPPENDHRTSDHNTYKTSTITTSTTLSTTTKPPSTYPNQLLETHNPYSINQAFHFSTPVDYQNFFDEYKETHATSGPLPQTPPQQQTSSQQPTEKPYEEPERQFIQQQKTPIQHQPTPPTYQQNYTPEIHYESEVPQSRYPTYETSDYTTKSEPPPEFETSNPVEPNNNNYQSQTPLVSDNTQQPQGNVNPPQEYNENPENHPHIYENLTEPPRSGPATFIDEQSSKSPYQFNQYETSQAVEIEQPSTTSTTSTTTRRTPLRSRGRPRYSTTKSDNEEYSTRSTVTRRPLRERRPLPTRPRYEPNKITTEKITRKPLDSSESTTAKSYRTRSRGKVHYKPSETDDTNDKRKKQNSKEQDLAYQRDVLHQNYPVTLMERMSTVDIEAITEPTLKVSSTNNLESTNPYDVENAYSNDQVSITQHTKVYTENNQEIPGYSKSAIESEDTYVPRLITREEDNIYHSRSSAAPIDAFSSYDETKEEDSYAKQTTPIPKSEDFEEITSTKLTQSVSEHGHSDSSDNDVPITKPDEETAIPENQETKASNTDINEEPEEPEENIVQTTPSYNRVRVRPGVIRQYHQASSTESSRSTNEKRKSAQAITYRPAFDRRRTTMRIDEIQADLKTKQVLAHPETQDIHPVYKPEPTTEHSAISVTQDSASKRGQFRRRRPTYTQTSTSTEATSTKKTYEIKNRFRGRRPTTDKPTEKTEVQVDEATTTTKSNLYSRYSHRPRLSERYHKKPETDSEGTQDQDPNYSLHRPKYAVPDPDQWSPKVSSDSFKPYNPNDVKETLKSAPAFSKSDNEELDIITAKNEPDDILISVTPATNNKANKIPDIPPTLEALVEQSKVTKTDSGDAMSTFESMLEEVMKSLEEQDQDEYTTNVMKHKGGEIGEIPPEKIISSGETFPLKSTTPIHEDTTISPTNNDSPQEINEEDATRKSRRRGFWKKVKVRPVTESIEAAESQYYSHTVNRLGHNVGSKDVHGKSETNDKLRVTTYKPSHQFIKNLFDNEDAPLDMLVSHLDIPRINNVSNDDSKTEDLKQLDEHTTKKNLDKLTTVLEVNPGDMDLGTGSPDPTLEDVLYYSEPTEATINESSVSVDRSDGFSLMDYLFGVTASDGIISVNSNKTEEKTKRESENFTKNTETETTSEQKPKIVTTESTYIPEEITAELTALKEQTTEEAESKNRSSTEITENPLTKVESSSISSYMDPANVVSTSMSTEVSHETEICFRGKCIKTNKDML